SGLPSTLLERRPDIRQAEDTLISANAEIGAAKALYFPQISLTGFLGGQSRSLNALFTGPARLWTIAPAGDLSIFNAGRLRNNVRYTEARQREMIATYEKAIQNGFREVSDALIEHEKDREQRQQEELFVKALREADRLSQLRYKGGLDSYLQVLDPDRQGGVFTTHLHPDNTPTLLCPARSEHAKNLLGHIGRAGNDRRAGFRRSGQQLRSDEPHIRPPGSCGKAGYKLSQSMGHCSRPHHPVLGCG